MDENIDKEVKKLRNLPQYKDADEKYLRKIAGQNIKKRELGFEELFSDSKERKSAVDLFTKYMDDYSFKSESDFQSLKSLVYNEIMLIKFQKIMDAHTNDKTIVPQNQMKAITEMQKQISIQKKELGLISEDTDKTDAYKALETMLKKFRTYQLEHPDEFYSRCPCCKEMIMWNFRVENYDPKKFPLLQQNRPWNDKVIELIKSKKITIEDAAEILESSPTYIRKILLKEECNYDEEI
jgi:hypothetical protein